MLRRLIVCIAVWALLMSGLTGNAFGDVTFDHRVIDDRGPQNPWTKILWDFNGDGYIDIVIGGQKGPLVLYTYPSWNKSVIAEGGYSTVDGEAGDVDGDGDPDIVMGGIIWYENPRPSGDTAKTVWKAHKVADHPTHDVEVGDLDGDGDSDIVTRDQSEFGHKTGNEIHVWLQDSSDVWTGNVIICPHGEGLKVADIDDDGDLDIVIGCIWYENTGNIARGEWVEHVFASFHPNATVQTADINQDGYPDVVLTPSELAGQFHDISWFENPGGKELGKWLEHCVDASAECVYHSLELADVNADGLIDILTAKMHQGSDPDEVSVYLNQTEGKGWRKQVLSTGGSHYLRAADIGNDGDIDIIGANHGGDYQPVELWENLLSDENVSLNSWTYIEVDRERAKWGDWNEPDWGKYFGLAMADVTGDGYKDIVSGRYFYHNPGGDMMSEWKRVDFGLNIDAMLFVDVDSDVFGDVIAEALPDVYWLEMQDRQGQSWVARKIGEIPKTSHGNGQGYTSAQIIAGGKPEILLSSGDGIYMIKIPEDPKKGLWPTTRIAAEATEEGIGVGDIDNDGDLDIAAGSAGKDKDGLTVCWWENPGGGGGDWRMHLVGSTIRFADRVAIADLDGDGHPDIIVTEERWPKPENAHLFWFEQVKEQGKQWSRHTISTQNTSNNLDVADMDGDGDIDIVTAEHRGSKKVQIFENRDNASAWIQHIVSSGRESHLGAQLADMDGDGDNDIVSIAWDDYKYLHLWRNDAVKSGTGNNESSRHGLSQEHLNVQWKHYSTAQGNLAVPNAGQQQTATAVFDVDKDGVNDFLIAERTQAPSVVWYRRYPGGWKRYVVDDTQLHIEAGSAVCDIDCDGDIDVVFGGDGGSNCVWWWENPCQEYDPEKPWTRHIIKDSGKNKHHDQLFGDFDGDGQVELAFWNQGARTLFFAEIPDDPVKSGPWNCVGIYSWSTDSQIEQRGVYPSWKSVNEHEGLASADIDGDGTLDIIGGGRWFKHTGGTNFMPNVIDASYTFSRCAAGQLIKGGRPEVVLVVGDGIAPMVLYEWKDGDWIASILIEEVDNGHSLAVVDFDGDGALDIFCAEMNLGENPDARAWILLGDGQGAFRTTVALEGFDNHESKIADLNGDGDYDILGKPYKWEAPRLDIWINEGK